MARGHFCVNRKCGLCSLSSPGYAAAQSYPSTGSWYGPTVKLRNVILTRIDRPSSVNNDANPARVTRLRRRDIVILPLIALCTVIVLGLGVEAAARFIFPEQQRDACEMTLHHGGEFKPNCQSNVKLAEGPWLEDRYNDCGYRSANACAAAMPGALRAAVLGTSIARGEWVRYPETFAGRVEADLTRACGRTVDLQNVSIPFSQSPEGYLWHLNAQKAAVALKLQPQALIFVVSPFDLGEYQKIPAALESDVASQAGGSEKLAPKGQGLTVTAKAYWDWLKNTSRAVLLLQHVMYSDQHRYVPMFLKHGDTADYLRPPFTPEWQMRLRIADLVIGRIADQARAASVPLIVAFVPLRAQAAMSADPSESAGADPFALGRALQKIVTGHGGYFADVTDLTREIPDQSELYYPVDTHPTAQGHALIARSVERVMLDAAPAFAGCHPVRSADAVTR